MAKKKVTGFKGVCQCGVVVGAIDYKRTDRKEAGKILGKWLHNGINIECQFTDNWHCLIKTCNCK